MCPDRIFYPVEVETWASKNERVLYEKNNWNLGLPDTYHRNSPVDFIYFRIDVINLNKWEIPFYLNSFHTQCISCFNRGLIMRNGSSDSKFGFILPLGLITVGVIGYFLSTLSTTGFTLMIFQWICIIAVLAGIILIILDSWDAVFGS